MKKLVHFLYIMISFQIKNYQIKNYQSNIFFLRRRRKKGAIVVEYVLLLFACVVIALAIHQVISIEDNPEDSGWLIGFWWKVIKTIAEDE